MFRDTRNLASTCQFYGARCSSLSRPYHQVCFSLLSHDLLFFCLTHGKTLKIPTKQRDEGYNNFQQKINTILFVLHVFFLLDKKNLSQKWRQHVMTDDEWWRWPLGWSHLMSTGQDDLPHKHVLCGLFIPLCRIFPLDLDYFYSMPSLVLKDDYTLQYSIFWNSEEDKATS